MNNQMAPEVMAMHEINFAGNIVPSNWYKHLRYESGRVNLNAITILSEIVYWYRPSEIRDEETGQLVGHKKKFKADKLQRSYQSFSDQFGLTKKQARDAVTFLEDKGLIVKELRTIVTVGVTLSNVLFLGIAPVAIKKITLQVTPMTSKSHPPDIEVIPSIPASQTYTESTAKNTTDIVKPKISKSEKVNSLASAIAKAANSDDQTFVKQATQLALDICDLCGLDIMTIINRDTQEALINIAISLYTVNVTAIGLRDFNVWWYANTWQGQKGQSPTPKLIGDTWGQFEAQKVINVPITTNGGFYV